MRMAGPYHVIGAYAINAPMDPTRLFALQLLRAVLEQHRPLDEALDRLPPHAEPRDRAAAHRLAATVLRHGGTLDAVLEPHLRRAPPDAVRWILRIGAAGLLFLDTPPHAAVATAVELARAQKLAPFAGLVNAVLRRVAAAGAAALSELDSPRLDTPAWLWASWSDRARAIALAHQHEAPLDLTLKQGVPPPDEGLVLPTGSIRFPAGTRVADLPGYAEGQFWVQDAAAALPARLLAPRPGEAIADLCAAPGGKTAQLAAAGAHVIAVESSEKRSVRLRENLARLHLRAEIVLADALTWQPPTLLDAVLLDAPCSATGTIRRHPDLPHIKRAQDIATLAAGQDRLIEAAGAMLRPGGRLIYAVCSLQAEEGPHKMIAGAGLEPDPFTAEETVNIPGVQQNGAIRTDPAMWPDLGGLDGFFICRFRKKAVLF
jgi:16S rRNA (cytosine967-C5)-methyltransferase